MQTQTLKISTSIKVAGKEFPLAIEFTIPVEAYNRLLDNRISTLTVNISIR